jgi:hypothetical protein
LVLAELVAIECLEELKIRALGLALVKSPASGLVRDWVKVPASGLVRDWVKVPASGLVRDWVTVRDWVRVPASGLARDWVTVMDWVAQNLRTQHPVPSGVAH